MKPFYWTSLLSITAAFFALALHAGDVLGLALPLSFGWARIHLITIGTATMFLFGAAPLLLAARMRTKAPSRAFTRSQWVLLTLGYCLLLIGMAGAPTWIAVAGGSAIFAAVLLLLYSLTRIGVASHASERTLLHFYLTGPAFFLIGITMAVSMLLHWSAPGASFGILEAHVHANAWGFLAFIVAGTLLELLPRIVKQPLAHPEWTAPTYLLLLGGGVGLVSGPWLGWHPLTLLGLGCYLVGTVLLLVNLVHTALRAVGGLPPTAAHLLSGYVWMLTPAFFAPFVFLAPKLVPTDRIETAAIQGLVFGWILQMAIGGISAVRSGAFPELMPAERPSGGQGRLAWTSVLLINAGAAALWIANLAPTGAPSAPGVVLGDTFIALGLIPFLTELWAARTGSVRAGG